MGFLDERTCSTHGAAGGWRMGGKRFLLLLVLSLYLLASIPRAYAQQTPNNFPKLPELLQYQASKYRQGTRWSPFRKYAMQRMRLPESLPATDLQLWCYHAELPDSTFSPAKPLFRQLQSHGQLGFAAIDHPTGALEIVFWDKRIYRHYADWLARIGYALAPHNAASNTLPFRKDGTSIHVDITIWADCYVLEVSG